MIIKTEEIILKEEILQLTNQRAVYWEKHGMLILSDLHIGKTAHFRRSGIPISSKVLVNDLERLKILIEYFKVEKIVIVGDMFHAEINDDIYLFSNWLKDFEGLEWILIKGNHDKWPNSFYQKMSIQVIDKELQLHPFKLIHDNKIVDDAFYILPCYQIDNNELRLPAFSLFTGLNTRKTNELCLQYAFTDESIFKI